MWCDALTTLNLITPSMNSEQPVREEKIKILHILYKDSCDLCANITSVKKKKDVILIGRLAVGVFCSIIYVLYVCM